MGTSALSRPASGWPRTTPAGAVPLRRAAGGLVVLGSALAVGSWAVTLLNRVTVRQLGTVTAGVIEPVTVCVPARDEAERLPALIADLRAQQAVPRLRVMILDDGSEDGTYDAALAAVGEDERFTVIDADAEPAPGWTGKTAACARLAELAGATGTFAPAAAGALIFLDADVRLAPDAIAAGVTELRRSGVGLVSAWPFQRAETVSEALVQPLLCWSWAATLPVRFANHTLRPSTAVACGQFLVFDARAYRQVGGHAAVAAAVTEDLALARALRRAGQGTELVAAGRVANTRMYTGAFELDTGYTRWLWSAYGSVAGSVAVGAAAVLSYWLPPLAALLGHGRIRRIGLLGYAGAVAGRVLARSLESGAAPAGIDALAALAHPLSVAAYLRLQIRSHRLHHTGSLTWKGRTLSARAG